jgi:superfamily II DNA or RNA helicase
MNYQPYHYQQTILDAIAANQNRKILVQLATGGGKTIIFTTLAKQYEGRVLILVDSKELVGQTAKHFDNGATFEAKDKVFPQNKIVVSMVQTLKSRIKKQPNLISDFDLVIIDECHIIQYEVLLPLIKCKLLGFTATPVSNRKDNYYYNFELKQMLTTPFPDAIEFTKDFALSEIFDDIIVGIPIQQLISESFLVPDENYIIPIDEDSFRFDKFGEVSNSDEVFDTTYQMDVLANYNEYCKGKKTMIFTQNTTLNKYIYDIFVEAGVPNCFMYDSVNDTDFDRSEVVELFRNTREAILFNVGVFTKGFDVTDVECIIVSRRVSSLSLWIQIVGRGSRITDKIFKDKFIVIDGGNNISRLGKWSDNFDWEKLFWGKDDYKAKKEAPEEMLKECNGCGELMKERTCLCPSCGHNNCKIKEIKIDEGLAVQQNVIVPDIKKIIEYCQKIDKDKIFALKILTSQIYQMFKKVPKEQFLSNRNTGVERVLNTHLKINYFKIINSDLPSSANRTLKRQKEILINKLEKKYL